MAERSQKSGGLKPIFALVMAVVCLVGGIVIGKFALSDAVLAPTAPAASIKNLDATESIAADKLDSVMASYSYDGKDYDLTVKDVLELSGSVESAKKEDGSYTMPPADGVLVAARAQIVLKEAEKQGIKVSDKELDEYTTKQLGSADYETLAKNYGIDVDMLKKLIREQAITSKLREKATDVKEPVAPEAPKEPKPEDKDKATKDFADYIIKLAGDQWDADKKSWKDEAGAYAAALANYNFDGKTATFEMATIAYKTAMTDYSAKSQEVSQKYQAYFNTLFSKATLSLRTLLS